MGTGGDRRLVFPSELAQTKGLGRRDLGRASIGPRLKSRGQVGRGLFWKLRGKGQLLKHQQAGSPGGVGGGAAVVGVQDQAGQPPLAP